jgi:hypothetical protein
VGNLPGLWLGNENKEREVRVFNLSIGKERRAGLNDRQFACWKVGDGRTGLDREQTKSRMSV